MKKILTNPMYTALAAVLCNVLWGSAYPAIKTGYMLFNITDSLFTKILFAGVRFTVAGLLVLLVSVFAEHRLPRIKKAGNFVLITLVYTVLQYIFFYVGLSNTTGTNGSIVNSTSVFLAVIIAHFVYADDKLNLRKIIGSVIGFGGVLLVTVGGGNTGFSVEGEGFIMIAALCFVIGSVLIKRVSGIEDSASLTGWNLCLGGAILIFIGIAGGGRFETVTAGGIAVLGYLAFLSAAAYTLWSLILKYNPVGKVSVYNLIIPVSGTIMSALFLNENIFEWKYLISLVLVCAGIIIVNKVPAENKKGDEKHD